MIPFPVLAVAALMADGPGPSPPRFPLKVSSNRRYLVDPSGRPFLIHGDSPWEIAWRLKREEAEELLDDRHARGFNAILVDVLPYSEWSDYLHETNRYGQGPLTTPGNLGAPNELYFAHLEWLIRAAEKRGMLILLVAADLGYAGLKKPEFGIGDGMWHPQYLANGTEKCRQYGCYLGKRFGKLPNVMWVLGGDRDPGDVRDHVEAMAAGLQETAPTQLRTYHAGAKSSSVFFQDAGWLDVCMSYGYGEPYAFVLEDCRKQPTKPCFLGESGYEGESNDRRPGTPQRVRRQAYWAMLSGACGHLYGSAAWTVAPELWRKWLNSPGAQHMAHFGQLFRSLDWSRLEPDADHQIVTAGFGEWGTAEYAATAWIPDGSLAVCYTPEARTLTVDLARLNGPVRVRWYDPTSGRYTAAPGSPLADTGTHEFAAPGKNGAGDADWVLVCQAAR